MKATTETARFRETMAVSRRKRGWACSPATAFLVSARRAVLSDATGSLRLDIMRRAKTYAFSLIEVVLALGIVAFAVIPVVGVLVTGLNTARDSNSNVAVANITRSLRANLQSDPTLFATPLPARSPLYYTDGGYPTTDNSTTGAFYEIDFVSILTPANSVLTSSSARVVLLSISYPYPARASSTVFSLLVTQ